MLTIMTFRRQVMRHVLRVKTTQGIGVLQFPW